MKKKDLIDRLSKALKRNDLGQIKEYRQALVEFDPKDTEFKDFAQRVRGRVLISLEEGEDEPYNIVQDAVRSMSAFAVSWFSQEVYRFYVYKLRSAVLDSFRDLEPRVHSYALGMPSDYLGVQHPMPTMPQGILSANATEEEILLIASPLLAVEGLNAFSKTSEGNSLNIMSKQAVAYSIDKVMEPRIEVSRGYRTKFDVMNRMFMRDAFAFEDVSESLKRAMDKYRERVFTELRHEFLRVKGLAEHQVIDSMEHISGYTLRSVFRDSEGKASSHREHDGKVFYKRSSGNTWSSRLVVPYRKNCRCFPVPIFDKIQSLGFDEPFIIRPGIIIRDFRMFQTWFDSQLPSTKQKIVGEGQWAANPHPTKALGSFFTLNGDLIPAEIFAREEGETEFALNRERMARSKAQRMGARFDNIASLIDHKSMPSVEAAYLTALRRKIS